MNWVVYEGTEAISMKDVKEAVGVLKNGKPAGLNKITREMIKNVSDWLWILGLLSV